MTTAGSTMARSESVAALRGEVADPYARLMALAEHDPQLKAAMPIAAVTKAIMEPGLSAYEVVSTIFDAYADRPALGARAYDIVRDGETGASIQDYRKEFETISYRELADKVTGIANAWRSHPQHSVPIDGFVCVFGFASIEFIAVDLAGVYAQATMVPLQANLGAEDVAGVFADTSPTAIVASIEYLDLVVDHVIAYGAVKSLVVMDYDGRVDEHRAKLEAARAAVAEAGCPSAVATLDELIEFGSPIAWEPLPPHPLGESRIAGLIYTSGSTGTPKGAIFTENMFKTSWPGLSGYAPPQPRIVLSYAPMNHFMGRNGVFTTLATGGTAYFTLKSDMSALFEDMRLVRPTAVSFIPRIAELVYHNYQSEKLRREKADPGNAEAIDAEIRREMATNLIGDRVCAMGGGSAPIAPEVQKFLTECFGAPFNEGYGSTETGGFITLRDRIIREYVTDYRLSDVPELGYYTSDKPYPRGELSIKSRILTPGYYNRPDATAAIFDDEGYLLTGDVVEERGPDHIVWLDRKNNVLKLSQGEFVAIGPLEAKFQNGSPVIRQMFLYGTSRRSFLLAVIVPDVEAARHVLGREPSPADLADLIRQALRETAQQEDLKSFETPRDFIIEMEPFSHENGLLSSVRKPLRLNLRRRYGERLEAIYADMERAQREDLLALGDPNSGLTLTERVAVVMKASLGLTHSDLPETQTFTGLGGDSLAAVGFAISLEEVFGVSVPVTTILSPTGTIGRLAEIIDRASDPDAAEDALVPSFAKVHGQGAQELKARDLVLSRFFPAEVLDTFVSTPPTGPTRTVLVTGSNGHLGRFLLLNWLERMADCGGKVISLIRGADTDQARRRLDEAFGEADPSLAEHFRTLANSHLEVMTGDLGEPKLGLKSSDYERLCQEVDHIVHPAALVNHKMTYQNLFEPNVVGTADLIAIALTGRQKPFDYISTSGMLGLFGSAKAQSEEVHPTVIETVPLADTYAAGYAASKWAGEVLLFDAHEKYGLPANVFRPDMILAHSRYRGQINLPDMFSRLLYSVITTGLAPFSFYELNPDGSRARGHYDGMPVDFIAGSIAKIGAAAEPGYRSYNVVNLHDDGVSLDLIVDWIEARGYRIERVRNFDEWSRKFAARVEALPESKRQHSSFNILNAYARPLPTDAPELPNQRFAAAVRDIGTPGEIPHLTREFIDKCVDDLRLLGLISPPAN